MPQELTLFSPLNMTVCVVLLVFVPWVASRLHPRTGQFRGIAESGVSMVEDNDVLTSTDEENLSP